ncbi:hypothetical protein [Bradyrhizobium sp. CCGUVB23]|uniref:hypothetical protein n=1 Tax=Bradyrhizobium sp. CCGUVB23 TaxID=2949630 RepID=UPI0020B2F231|nr:hypothetical protein [Bradyrhizobium sp. CCGUVB23]MCP3459963.1 hypothetical protein [Bradyrhizobium sp. CCGUVB23]
MKRFIALSPKMTQLPKTKQPTLFNPSLRGSEAIQGAGQVLDHFAASSIAFARRPKLTSQ